LRPLQKEVFGVLEMRERVGRVREKLLERVGRLYPVELRIGKCGGKAKGKDWEQVYGEGA